MTGVFLGGLAWVMFTLPNGGGAAGSEEQLPRPCGGELYRVCLWLESGFGIGCWVLVLGLTRLFFWL